MPDTNAQLLLESLADALETMAFISPMPAEEPWSSPAKATLISIAFGGSVAGTIELVAPEELGCTLVSNILGTDPSDPEVTSRAPDALRELLNVTCGVLLPKLTGSNCGRCEMAVPTQRTFDAATEWTDFLASPGTSVMDAEGHPVAIRLKEKS